MYIYSIKAWIRELVLPREKAREGYRCGMHNPKSAGLLNLLDTLFPIAENNSSKHSVAIVHYKDLKSTCFVFQKNIKQCKGFQFYTRHRFSKIFND